MAKETNTPFNVVQHENDYFVCLGNNALLKCTSEKEAYEKINNRDYELLFNLIYLIQTYENKTQNNSNEQRSTEKN